MRSLEPENVANHQGRLSAWLQLRLIGDRGEDPRRFDPAVLRSVLSVANRLFGPGCYFDMSVRGLEKVPHRPSLLVSNHSGGSTIPDVWGLAVAWYRHFGASRPLHILGHELIFSTPIVGEVLQGCGVLRANHEIAHEVLGPLGRDLLIMPGGDIEVWRPWRDRYRIDFAGRRGYARLALETQVPIVPIAHAGAHDTLMVLSSGRRLARVLGLHRLVRADVWPIHLSLPWIVGFGPLPHLPLPARFRYLIGDPIVPPARPPDDERAVRELDAAVREAIQRQLSALAPTAVATP